MKRTLCRLFFAVFFGSLVCLPLHGQTFTFNNAGGDNLWSNPANWTNAATYPDGAGVLAAMNTGAAFETNLDVDATVGGLRNTAGSARIWTITNPEGFTVTLNATGFTNGFGNANTAEIRAQSSGGIVSAANFVLSETDLDIGTVFSNNGNAAITLSGTITATTDQVIRVRSMRQLTNLTGSIGASGDGAISIVNLSSRDAGQTGGSNVFNISGELGPMVAEVTQGAGDTPGMVISGDNSLFTGSVMVLANAITVSPTGTLGNENAIFVADGASLNLQNPNALGADAFLILGASGTAALNFDGTNVMGALSLDGGESFASPGVWGALGSGAEFESERITGTGLIDVQGVPTAPFWVLHPVNVTAFVGETVTLTAQAFSASPIDYQWQHLPDGEEIWEDVDGATSATYTLEDAPYSARGQYRLLATADEMTEISNVATVALSFGPPRILQPIVGGTFREGDTRALVVVAEGAGNLTYSWTKDGEPLSETSNTLDLGTVTADDAGTYTVTVTDDAGVAFDFDPTSVTLTAMIVTFDAPPASRAIGLNFVGTANGTTSSGELGVIEPEEPAGILGTTNWNNSATVTGVANQTVPFPLDENTGAENVASATWSAANTWAARTATGTPDSKDADQRLYHGYIESRAGSSVVVNDIPYGQYDVYVYPMGIEGASGAFVRRVFVETEGGATIEFFGRNYSGNPPQPFIPYLLATGTTVEEAQAVDPATVFRFPLITGSSVTIRHEEAVGNNLGGIAGISIVDRTPEGAGYPPLVTSRPQSRFVPAGGNVELSVTAVSQNDDGVLSYEWTRNGTVVGSGPTLTFNEVSSEASGAYTVTITDSAAPDFTRTAEATLVVVDGARPALLSVDMQVGGGHAPMHGHAILREDGPVPFDPDNPRNDIGIDNGVVADTIWNGRTGVSGTATYGNLVDADGLLLPGLSLTVAGTNGAEDAPTGAGIDAPITDYSGPLLRDYVFTTGENEMTVTVAGLQSFVGRDVTLVVYAIGKESVTWEGSQDDVATVTLAAENSLTGQAESGVTAIDSGSRLEGRDLRYNNHAHVTFTARVATNGTVSWTIGPVPGVPGLNAFNGFQMLITDEGEPPEFTPLETWRLTHFGSAANDGPGADLADFDGDGFLNLLKYGLGANPTVAGSALGLVTVEQVDGVLRLAFAHIDDPSLIYQIEATENIDDGWNIVHTYPAFTEAGTEVYETPATGDRHFLRLRITRQ